MLEIRGLKKRYGKTVVLDGLDLTVPDGELFGFAGLNGAGKTTTLRIIAGLLAADGGTVTLDGEDMLQGSREIRSRIGYVPDSFGVYDNLRVREYMDFFASCYGLTGLKARRRIGHLLERVGIYDKRNYFVDSLSRGMKQRLCLARALIHDPDLLILDEPASGLDPRTRNEYMELLKEMARKQKTIVLSSHILSELAQTCTSVGILDQGRMVLKGPMEEIIARVNASNPLYITVAGDRAQAVRILKTYPSISTISVGEDAIRIEFSGTVKDEADLLATLVDEGVPVSGFLRERGNLESIFMKLTGGETEITVASDEMEPGF